MNFELFGLGCRYTDDSVMTMAVAEWLLDDPGHSHEVLEKKMVNLAIFPPNFIVFHEIARVNKYNVRIIIMHFWGFPEYGHNNYIN